MSKAELSHLQQFFYAFWEERKPADGEMAWLEYREKLAFVESEFGTRNKRGYNTDRGRIWLQYGAPNDITDRPNEPSSYPYQIWRYYKAGQWNNVRFVFYDTTLLAEDYELLHSDNIPGELRNPQWQLLLEQRNTPMNNVDERSGRNHAGGRVDMLFENPR
jgi:GWxTD domain-containing protein